MKEQIQLSDHFTYGRLIRFTLPSIGMMIFMSIYSVVDGYFVSNFAGKTPFAALNLIFPVLMIMSTVGFMFGTGGSAIVAKTLGMRDSESANRYFSLFVYIAFGLGAILAVVSFVFIRPIAILLGAEGQLLEDAVLYGRIILVALPSTFFRCYSSPSLSPLKSRSWGWLPLCVQVWPIWFWMPFLCFLCPRNISSPVRPLLPQQARLWAA